MTNLNYSRFEDTHRNMEDCLVRLGERNIPSKREGGEAKLMLEEILDFCYTEGIIPNYDKVKLSKLIEEGME